jgi:hypothetical protein
LRDELPRIQALGADVVVIGTGDQRYARAFARDERIPFPLLVDDEALAAEAAGVERVGLARLFAPASFPATARAFRRGFRLGRPGRRVSQLGASFVVAPGPVLLLRHHDAHPADHAPIETILDALRSQRGAA